MSCVSSRSFEEKVILFRTVEIMAPLEPLMFTVQLKTPIPAGDRSLGSPVYSPGNTEGDPQFYKDFMDCLHGADGSPIPLDVLGLDDELRELVSDFWDGLYERVFGRESCHKGGNLSSHMKTTLQLRNFIYVCRLMIGSYQCWYVSSLEYDRDGQNFVTVDDNSLSIHDSRGNTHTYSYYFIKKMHDIIDHASNIFAQERLGKVLIGPRVVSSVKFSDREAKPR
eukprot:scaffold68143_cov60-Attheya_sp.AAC.2